MEIKRFVAINEKANIGIFIGHSEKASGAESPTTGLNEWDFNKPVAYALADNLIKHHVSTTIYERELHDEFSEMINHERTCKYDLVLSLHLNCYYEKTEGTEILYWHRSKKGKKLAEFMLPPIMILFGGKERGIKPLRKSTRGSIIVRKTQAPTIIIEAKFIDNINDEKRLREYQDLYDEALFMGVISYLRWRSKAL